MSRSRTSLWRELGQRAKWPLYRLGILDAYHRMRNRAALTVVMFHRVLPESDPRWSTADPRWTVPDVFFEDCLKFFVKHYNVVRIEQVLERAEARCALPERPLLITLDDGWSDTEEHAARLLQKMKLPAVVFVVANAVDGAELWQEIVRRLWRLEPARPELLACVGQPPDNGDSGGLPAVIRALSGLAPQSRQQVIESVARKCGDSTRAEMVSRDQVLQMRAAGCAIGSHGLTHTSISLAQTAWEELYESRCALGRVLGEAPGGGPRFLSFPNGRYNVEALQLAQKAGYACVFTSDGVLNLFVNQKPSSAVLGRIEVPYKPNSGTAGRLRPELLACWLFLRPAVPVRPLAQN